MRWALWWLLILALYALEFCAQVWSEAAAGAIIAAIATLVAWAALSHARPGVRVRWRWLRHLAGVPAGMLRDALLVSRRVLWAIARGGELAGYLERVEYAPCDGADPYSVGREALVITGINAAPNSMVCDVDDRGSLVIHRLVAVPAEPRSSREWPL